MHLKLVLYLVFVVLIAITFIMIRGYICVQYLKKIYMLFINCTGCVNIPLREIPSTGVEAWYKLEARSQRSSVQGRIRLRLWLSAREAGRHDDDNWQQVLH